MRVSRPGTPDADYAEEPDETGKRNISHEEKQKAYNFWTRDPKTGLMRNKRLKGSTVLNQFRGIKTMQTLYEFEQQMAIP